MSLNSNLFSDSFHMDTENGFNTKMGSICVKLTHLVSLVHYHFLTHEWAADWSGVQWSGAMWNGAICSGTQWNGSLQSKWGEWVSDLPPPVERSRAEWSDVPKKWRIGGKRSLAHSPCLLRSTRIAIPGSVCCILLQSAPLHAALLAHLGRISLSEKSRSMSSTFFRVLEK